MRHERGFTMLEMMMRRVLGAWVLVFVVWLVLRQGSEFGPVVMVLKQYNGMHEMEQCMEDRAHDYVLPDNTYLDCTERL